MSLKLKKDLFGVSCQKYTYLGIVILFYSNEHEPIHVHEKHQGYESKAEFIIEKGKVKEILIKPVKGRKPLRPIEQNDFRRFVETHANEIIGKWIDYFVLHKQVTRESVQRRIP
uniref:DUF4160 domain-containing protein n=1 Tax=Candidatus Kentrum sp. TC TaxID=2126339 RepID=A0A450YEG7_9GAMM|nr:MAG: protein of unknown function (DUF4160) [Candidatus Kentron sp. TC]